MEKDKNKLKNDNELKLLENIGNMIEIQEGTINNVGKIIDIIEVLQKTVAVLFFLVSILIWRVFLLDPFNELLNAVFCKWNILPEEYKILILSLIGGIPAMIIAHIVGSILSEKIKKTLNIKK